MSIKTILVSLNDSRRTDELLKIAGNLATRHNAHLSGLYVRPSMQLYPSIGMQVSPEMYEAHNKYFQDRSDDVEKQFDEICQRLGVSSEWRSVDSNNAVIADKVIEHSFQADLVIIGQFDENNTGGIEMDFAERVVMEAGRPILVVPLAGSFDKVGENIVVGWNATREAARAAFDALPFIQTAQSTRVVWINPQKDRDHAGDFPGAELATVLARHGANVTADATPAGKIAVDDVLLNIVSDEGADLLVMGAYGHNRLREYVFGGTTHNVFRHMTVPVLLSH